MRRSQWLETEGTVSEVYEDGGRSRNISVVFTYTVDGHFYGGTFKPLLKTYSKGDPLLVKYDPDSPDKNNYVSLRMKFKWLIPILIGMALAAIMIFFTS